LLIDLDRVERGVLAAVLHALDVGVEGTGQPAHTVLQNVGETHQQRQRKPRLAQLFDQGAELDGRAIRPLWPNLHATLVADREVARSPMADAVDAAAVRCGPLAAVVFTCASNRHLGLPEQGWVTRREE